MDMSHLTQLEQLVEQLIKQNRALKEDKFSLEQQLVKAQKQFALSQHVLNELHQLQEIYHMSHNKPRIKAQSTG